MQEGKIKKLNAKGFGFITVPGREKDLFFHSAGLAKDTVPFNSLKEGDTVEFEGIEPTPKGDQAFGVRVVY